MPERTRASIFSRVMDRPLSQVHTPVVVEAGIATRRDDPELTAAASAGEEGRSGEDTGLTVRCSRFIRPSSVWLGSAEDRRDLLLPFRTACQRSSSIILRCGTSVLIHWLPGWGARPASGGWVLDKPLTVPDEDAGIKLVVEDACAARDMTANAGVTPCPSKRPGMPSLFRSVAIASGSCRRRTPGRCGG